MSADDVIRLQRICFSDDSERGEVLAALRNRTEGAYEEFGSSEVAWLLDEHGHLNALNAEQAATIEKLVIALATANGQTEDYIRTRFGILPPERTP